jgi:hypothetical protein
MSNDDPLDDGEQQTDGVLDNARSSGRSVGNRLGDFVVMAFSGLLSLFAIPLYLVLRIVPKSQNLGQSFVNVGYKLLLKTTGGDTIVNEIYGDGVVKPKPASWQSDEHEFRTVDGEAYKADKLGFPYRHDGKFGVAWALREGREVTDPLEAYIGGQRRRGNFEEHLRTDGAGKDVAILAETEGYEGRALSFRDGWRLFGSKVTQEDMKRQETRGKLAELDWSTRQQLYLVLVFAGGLALGMFGPALAQSIAGGGGGIGGGLSLPIMLGPLLEVI